MCAFRTDGRTDGRPQYKLQVNTYLTRKVFRKLSGARNYWSDSKRLLYTHLVFWGSIMPYFVPQRCEEQARFVDSYEYSAVVMRNPWNRIASAYWDKMEVMALREKPCNEFLESCCELRRGLFGAGVPCGPDSAPSFSDFLSAVEAQIIELGETNDHWERQTRLCNLGAVPYRRVFDLVRDRDAVLEYIGATPEDVAAVQSPFTSAHKRSPEKKAEAFLELYGITGWDRSGRIPEPPPLAALVGRMYKDDIEFARLHGIEYTFEGAVAQATGIALDASRAHE